MKTNPTLISAALLAVGICAWCADARAQETTTTTTAVTTTNGAFTEFIPSSETIVVRSDANPAPLRYVVTKKTTIVDEAGAPIAIEKISPGSPLSVQYTGASDRLTASRIVVHRAPVTTTVPVTTGAPVVTEEHTTSTTTTTRPLTHDEKEAIKDRREDEKERLEHQIERRKDELEKAKDKEEERLEDLKDKLDDDHH